MKNQTKKYKLLQTELNIKYEDKVMLNGEWQYGYTVWKGPKCMIYISLKDDDNNDLTEEEIEMTVRHELFHFMFSLLYYKTENDNEPLIEWLARATQILNKQGLTI